MKTLKKVVAIAAAATVAALSAATVGSGMTASAADQIAEAYFIGTIGTNQSWGESDGASVTAIDGDAQYAVTWKLDEAAETGNSWFLAVVITTEVNGTIMTNEVDGSNVNFTTDSYPDLAVTLDAIYIDGTEVTGFTVSSGAINTAYYESDPGVTRIYLRDDWAGTGTAILEDCTIESEVTAVFTISGTGQTGTSNVSDVINNMSSGSSSDTSDESSDDTTSDESSDESSSDSSSYSGDDSSSSDDTDTDSDDEGSNDDSSSSNSSNSSSNSTSGNSTSGNSTSGNTSSGNSSSSGSTTSSNSTTSETGDVGIAAVAIAAVAAAALGVGALTVKRRK